MFRFPIFYAVLAFFASQIIIGFFLPALACMDGWVSNSIGRSGACSHHGGVNHFPQLLSILFSGIFSFYTWKYMKKNEKSLKNPDNKRILRAEKHSQSLLRLVNKLFIFIYNTTLKLIYLLKLDFFLNKRPVLSIFILILIVLAFPPIVVFGFFLWGVAFFNDADVETKYIIK